MTANRVRTISAVARCLGLALVILGPCRSTRADSIALEVDPGSPSTLAPNESTTIDIVYVDDSTSYDSLTQYDVYFSYNPSQLTLGTFVNGPAVSGSDFYSPLSSLFNDNNGIVTGGNFATNGIAVTAGSSYIVAQFTVTATSSFTSGTTVLNLLPTDSTGSTDLGFASGQFLDSSTANGYTTLFDVPVTYGTNDPGDLTLSAASVPEPASVITVGLGLCAIVGVCLRQRRSSTA